ncbi:MAG: PIN domain-containing protein, partial [Candidatus Acidiferrales bacterium]
ISLDADEYLATIEECSASKIVGGAVYDALLARCAVGAGAESIYTWNVRHFERFGPEIRGRLQTP